MITLLILSRDVLHMNLRRFRSWSFCVTVNIQSSSQSTCFVSMITFHKLPASYYNFVVLVGRWSSMLFTLNQVLSSKNMKLVSVLIQPFLLFASSYMGEIWRNCIVFCTFLTWTWRLPFPYTFPDVPQEHNRTKYDGTFFLIRWETFWFSQKIGKLWAWGHFWFWKWATYNGQLTHDSNNLQAVLERIHIFR